MTKKQKKTTEQIKEDVGVAIFFRLEKEDWEALEKIRQDEVVDTVTTYIRRTMTLLARGKAKVVMGK